MVIDFGIARAADGIALTATSSRIGSPGYMAPEQISANITGPESDIFALGAVLAYAATGRSPFGGGPADAVLYRVLHEEPHLDGVPASLRPLVAACLAKDPRDRPTPARVLDASTGDPATLLQAHASPQGSALAETLPRSAPTRAAPATAVWEQYAPPTEEVMEQGPRRGVTARLLPAIGALTVVVSVVTSVRIWPGKQPTVAKTDSRHTWVLVPLEYLRLSDGQVVHQYVYWAFTMQGNQIDQGHKGCRTTTDYCKPDPLSP